MPDHGERQALHRLCDSVSGANWRPTRFEDELTLSRYACCLCHVVPSTTVVLPCSHALCEQCLTGCAVQDTGSVCPVDTEPFCEDECQRWQLPAKKKQNLKAHCWNEADGCEFVDTIEAVLLHYDRECTFHALQCPRCEQRILRTDIAAHYVTGCSQNASCASSEEPNGQDSSPNSFDLSAMLDKLSTLQRQMNEVLESRRTSDSAPSLDISSAVSGFENSLECGLKVLEANICTTVASQLNAGLEELKALIRDPCSDRLSTVQSQVNELVEQSRAHDASQFQELLRALRDSECELKRHADRVEASLSSRLADAQRSLQRSIDSLQENFESFGSERLLAVATSREGNWSSSWSMEKRFILRKLESFATESTRTLELLRQQVNRHDDKPWVSTVLGSHGGICRSMSSSDTKSRPLWHF
ncbi:hypothetical protein HPB52_003699 [Rhipicephalus sanguineus]|uniref:Uncharacterized protein n=1 Tax=Rhipicephalus sanguineus TaxID=34632 RepID=A0A9D4QCT3_RHISA|nr:hypothetical protein HPB52_003699 [Rhipicephalus sanguineus]